LAKSSFLRLKYRLLKTKMHLPNNLSESFLPFKLIKQIICYIALNYRKNHALLTVEEFSDVLIAD